MFKTGDFSRDRACFRAVLRYYGPVGGAAAGCYNYTMVSFLEHRVSAESRFFWWEPVNGQRRSAARIVAQAMNYAPFGTVLRLEQELGPGYLTDIMLGAAPGWFSERSWEFWRGRLVFATGRAIPEQPPRRSFDADPV
jgi:hypothetical protein